MNLEKRILPEATEMRVEGEGEQRKITGYAAVFNRKSENLGGFVEVIRPGAFRKVLDSDPDVRALFNHDSNYVLGRTKSGTLKLEENQTGLKFEAIPPDTQWARDLMTSIERGDVNQCSFSFRPAKDGDKWTEQKSGLAHREITEMEYLGDVGPVTFPAYPQTSVQARALTEAGLNQDQLTALFVRAQRGLPLTSADHDLINASIATLRSYLPEGEDETPEADSQLQDWKRNLELQLLEIGGTENE